MKLILNNNLSDELSVSSVSGSSPKPNWQKIPSKTQGSITVSNNRLVIFKVPHGESFALKPIKKIFFEFIQAKSADPNNDGMDTYVFRATKFQSPYIEFNLEEENDESGGGDADIDPPPAGFPMTD